MDDNLSKKAAFFYLMGETNSGKSTLMNTLSDRKVSIVTHKVQTTNIPFYSSFENQESKVYLLDTPGLFKKNFQANLNIKNVNFYDLREKSILFIVDANRRNLTMSKMFIENQLNKKGNKIYVIINKIDKVKKEKLLEIVDDFKELEDICEFFMISALRKDGIEELKDFIMSKASFEFDKEELYNYTHLTRRFLFSEITREKVYEHIHEEIPYTCRVESEIKKDRIYQTIFVSKKEHIPIIIGKGAVKIKKIGEISRKSISKITGRNIHLFVNVALDPKVSKK